MLPSFLQNVYTKLAGRRKHVRDLFHCRCTVKSMQTYFITTVAWTERANEKCTLLCHVVNSEEAQNTIIESFNNNTHSKTYNCCWRIAIAVCLCPIMYPLAQEFSYWFNSNLCHHCALFPDIITLFTNQKNATRIGYCDKIRKIVSIKNTASTSISRYKLHLRCR
jgi:hypothetical protein